VYVTQIKLTGSGTVTSSVENSNNQSPATTMCNAWNDFARKAGACLSRIDSLYGYMKWKATNGSNSFDGTFDPSFGDLSEYLRAVFNDPGLQNEWDI
jgi:hypothetical protein